MMSILRCMIKKNRHCRTKRLWKDLFLSRLIAGDISMNNLDSDEECGITMAGKQEIGFLRQVNFTEKDVTVEEEIKKVFEPVFACG